MKRFSLALLALLWVAPASALLCPSVPNTFSNGTVADANQVNADFTALLSCFNNNTATSGTNVNITTLTGLSAPPSGLGSIVFSGGVAGGTANALTVSATNPTGYSTAQYSRLWFLPALANTAAATLNSKAILKQSSVGLTALVGGEMQPNAIADMVYDGTEYVLINPAARPVLAVPQVTVYTAGSGTYTTPANAAWLEVEMAGPGSGGGGAGVGGTGGASAAAGSTTFGALTATGGGASPVSGGTTPPAASTATGGDVNISGALGGPGNGTLVADAAQAVGGQGGGSCFGGGAAGGAGSYASPSNAQPYGSGGGGGVVNAAVAAYSGWGGNAGACLTKVITTLSATYSYAVGAGTAGGLAGTSGTAGSAGAGGLIKITAH